MAVREIKDMGAFHQNEFLRKLWNNYNPGPGLEKPDFISVLNQIDKLICLSGQYMKLY